MLFAPIAIAAEMPIPASVDDLGKLSPGRLVQVKGYSRIGPKGEYQIESLKTGRKVTLDFSGSTIRPEVGGLDTAKTSDAIAIEVVGRVDSGKESGALAVVGYARLTPSL